MPTFTKRLQSAWNAFVNNKDPTSPMSNPNWMGHSSFLRPDRSRVTRGKERTIVTAIYNRIAIDVAAVNIQHVRVDQNGRYTETIDDGLNQRFTLEANIDQTGRAFVQDAVMSMLDEGCIALVPVDTDMDPYDTSSFDILSMRVGKITQWYPLHVKVMLYNDRTGLQEEVVVPKATTAIIENPLYAVMNEPNSTLQRLLYKLSLLDAVDEQSSSGKLDLIIQLPYTIKTEARRQQAEQRRKDIEMQLSGSKYGIAYTDGTEHITQLNRSVENNLMNQIEYLTSMLYSQLGLTEAVFNGTADEKTMLNYYNRTIEPILSAIVDELKRKFLTKNARSRLETVMFFRDPFELATVEQIAGVAQTFIGQGIATPNEMRSTIGWKPSTDPSADQLGNRNINPDLGGEVPVTEDQIDSTEEESPPEEVIEGE